MVEIKDIKTFEKAVAFDYKDLGIYFSSDKVFRNLIVDSIILNNYNLIILPIDDENNIYQVFKKNCDNN